MKSTFYTQLLEEEKRLLSRLEVIRLLKREYEDENETHVAIQSYPTQPPLITTRIERPPLPKSKKSLGKKLDVVASQYYNAWEKPLTQYNKNLTQIQKVVFALREIIEGDRDEIANKIIEFEPNLNKAKAIKFSAYHASKLNTLKLIRATKLGYKNVYSIKE